MVNTYTIRKLEWIAKTNRMGPIWVSGHYAIFQLHEDDYHLHGFGGYGAENTLEKAKELAQEIHDQRIVAKYLEPVVEEQKCGHGSTKPSWNWVQCLDCGMICPDTTFGAAANKWFKNHTEAQFFQANGRYPD